MPIEWMRCNVWWFSWKWWQPYTFHLRSVLVTGPRRFWVQECFLAWNWQHQCLYFWYIKILFVNWWVTTSLFVLKGISVCQRFWQKIALKKNDRICKTTWYDCGSYVVGQRLSKSFCPLLCHMLFFIVFSCALVGVAKLKWLQISKMTRISTYRHHRTLASILQ